RLLVSFRYSIHQHQHRSLLRRLHYVLKFLLLCVRLLQLGRNLRHRFQKAQKITALHGVVDILRQRVRGVEFRARDLRALQSRQQSGRHLPQHCGPGLEYDTNHNFKLNLWSYDYPRFTEPFYYGRAAHGMTLILMFDKMYSPEDEIRFSLFKFKVPRRPRPAWDFQYVIHKVEEGRSCGFKGRLIWKKFV